MQRFFLTGGTGVLGSFMLKRLLANESNQIVCLVRADSSSDASERVEAALSGWLMNSDEAPESRQLKVIAGDLTLPQFGLSTGEYQDLCATIDTVVHVAAETALIGRERDAYTKINVDGTQRVVEFVASTQSRRLLHVSSFSVLGHRYFEPSFVFTETDFDVAQKFPLMPYQESKFAAEKLVRESDVNWSIFRPGNLFGESTRGDYPPKLMARSVFYNYLRSIATVGRGPISDWKFDLTPIDFVADAILALGCDHSSLKQTYHLTDPTPLTLREINYALARSGCEIDEMPLDEFIRAMANFSGESSAFRTLLFWIQGLGKNFSANAAIDSRWTFSELSRLGFRQQSTWGEALLDRLTARCRSVGFMPGAK
jgi:thioester reductase-like protein